MNYEWEITAWGIFQPSLVNSNLHSSHFSFQSQKQQPSSFADPVSRKSVKSTHSARNRYSSQWTLTKCQASTPARTLASDWRAVGSQHGITVTESDSFSASLSQDTGELSHSHKAQPFKPSCSLLCPATPELSRAKNWGSLFFPHILQRFYLLIITYMHTEKLDS